MYKKYLTFFLISLFLSGIQISIGSSSDNEHDKNICKSESNDTDINCSKHCLSNFYDSNDLTQFYRYDLRPILQNINQLKKDYNFFLVIEKKSHSPPIRL